MPRCSWCGQIMTIVVDHIEGRVYYRCDRCRAEHFDGDLHG